MSIIEKIEFPSTVNFVYMVRDKYGGKVLKKYGDASKNLKISLCIERRQVEVNVLRVLEKLSNRMEIGVPKLLDFGFDFIELELINGKTLGESINNLQSIDDSAWSKLGRWLQEMQYILYASRFFLFNGLWRVENQNAEIMHKIKTPKSEFFSRRTSVSLGDVGLNNIIWSDNSFLLIDFEFCHLSTPGRDAGQLTAQLRAKERKCADDAASLIKYGYVSAGGNCQDIEFWNNAFKDYYARNY